MSIDTLVQTLWDIREEKRELANKEKTLNAAYESAKQALMVLLDSQGVSGAKTSVARVSITESQVVQVEDWDSFYQYIKENDAFYLLQKRPASTAVKELNTLLGITTPGTNLITLKDISITKVSK